MQPMRMVVTHVNVNLTTLAIIGVIGYLGYEVFRVVGEELPETPVERPSKNKTFRRIVKWFIGRS